MNAIARPTRFRRTRLSGGPEGRASTVDPRISQDSARPSGPPLNSLLRVECDMPTDRFAAEGAAVVPGVVPVRPSLAMLLAAHILRDGELVILILRPSFWFILLSSLWFLGGVAALMVIARLVTLQNGNPVHIYMELGIFTIAGRLMWAILQWMGRLYVLTDMRILILTGVFRVDVFDCPLRKIARTRVVRTTVERIVAVGSIEIIPQDDNYPFGIWQTIDGPDAVNEQIVATINRAKRNANGGQDC